MQFKCKRWETKSTVLIPCEANIKLHQSELEKSSGCFSNSDIFWYKFPLFIIPLAQLSRETLEGIFLLKAFLATTYSCKFLDVLILIFVRLFPFLLSLILHLCLSDTTGSVAHCPGATRRGGADHTGQWGKFVWEWEREKRHTQPLLLLSHSLRCILNFWVTQENWSLNRI